MATRRTRSCTSGRLNRRSRSTKTSRWLSSTWRTSCTVVGAPAPITVIILYRIRSLSHLRPIQKLLVEGWYRQNGPSRERNGHSPGNRRHLPPPPPVDNHLSRVKSLSYRTVTDDAAHRCRRVPTFIDFTTQRYASAVYAMALCLSVRLCVCHKPVFCQNG